jgi:hypothetical protein
MPYTLYIPLISLVFVHFQEGFSRQHHSRPDSAAQDIYPDNNRPDPNDLQDFKLPDQQTLIDAFLRGLCKLYEPSPVPTLYVGRIEDLLGRVPLFQCFLDGNATSTIPHKYAPRQKQDFAFGCADGSGQGFPSQKPKGSAERPDLIRPAALRGPGRPGSVQLKKYDKYIPGIYQSCVHDQ